MPTKVVRVPASWISSSVQSLRRVVGMDTDILVRDWTVWIPELAEAHDGVKLAHMSDFHVGLVTPDQRIRNAVELVARLEPDVCLMTGDFASRRPSPIRRLGPLLSGLPRPTFFVLGNHDHKVDALAVVNGLEEQGFVHLDNRHHSLRLRGHDLHLIGLDDPVTCKHDPASALRHVPDGGTRIVLAHLAESLAEVMEHEVDVQLHLSGHTHGGQIHLPGVTEPLMARFADLHHIHGLQRFEGSGPWVHISKGIGSAVNPLRFRARPEVSLLTLRRDRAGRFTPNR